MAASPIVLPARPPKWSGDRVAYVGEFYPGGNAQTRAENGKLSTAQAAMATTRLAYLLARFHALGISHNDVKPGNILFDSNGFPILIDYGLATDGWKVTTDGTDGYIPPEAEDGNPVFGKSDDFALGTTLLDYVEMRLPVVTEETERRVLQSLRAIAISLTNPAPDGRMSSAEPYRQLSDVCQQYGVNPWSDLPTPPPALAR